MKTALIIAAVAVVLVAVALFVLPRRFRVERSAVIARPVREVFQIVADLHERPTWTVWGEKDPGAVYSFEGAPGAVGSTMSWKGKEIGEGGVTILAAQDDVRLATRLELRGDVEMVTEDTFTFEALAGDKTRVTWSNAGELKGAQRVFGLFLNGMLGGDYEKGLANLRRRLESQPEAGETALAH